jgi:hypothetical protein
MSDPRGCGDFRRNVPRGGMDESWLGLHRRLERKEAEEGDERGGYALPDE